MTTELLTYLAGAGLSLTFSYVPGVRERYAKLDATQKRLVMPALLLIATISVAALACGNVYNPLNLVCTQAGLIQLAVIFIRALIANQATYLLSPQPDRNPF